ncbi:putative hydrolases or acyltransferases (alpha/beta hydrolase superfamily) [Salinisphaera sp. LB1]|nr:putative hydrolases or acyltransferases (alpha/beta hydrolase superfamily) [Salinisphaera sp. LB1]
MHGATFSSASLFDVPLEGQSFMDVLARAGFDVWAVDVRGYGSSSRPAAFREAADANPPQTPAIVAEQDLAAAIDAVCARQAIGGLNLLGMSWGGSVAGRYASRHPERVEKLVLVAPLWLSEQPLRIDQGGPLLAWRDVSLHGARDAWLADAPKAARHDLLPDDGFEQWLEVTRASDTDVNSAATVRAPGGAIADIRNHWHAGKPLYDPGDITSPTLIVHAEWDRDVRIDMMQNLFSQLEHARYRRWLEIGGGTHRILLERQREQAFDAITGFLAEERNTQ